MKQELDRILPHFPQTCRCEKCRLDIQAYALNRLPSHYVVSRQGELYAKVSQLEFQMRVDLQSALIQAIEVVTRSPRHQESQALERDLERNRRRLKKDEEPLEGSKS